MKTDPIDKERIAEAGELLASLSPYSTEEAAAIIEAITVCMPIGNIMRRLTCSPRSMTREEAKTIIVLD